MPPDANNSILATPLAAARRQRLSTRGRWQAWLALLAALSCCGGAGCPQWINKYKAPPPPRLLPVTATLDDVVRTVNEQTARVQSLYTQDASISVPMTPSLRGNLVWERPRRLRLKAETTLSGPELDLGSNDQLFWFWVRRMEPPAVYYCRHDQYGQSAARYALPIQPDWLPEAIGVVEFEPTAQHSGPFPTRNGRLEIRSVRQGPTGPQTKVTVIDAVSAWILEQHLYDARGERIASSITSQHERDPASGITLPRRVEIQVPTQQFSLRIDLRNLQINTPVASGGVFDLPSYANANLVDLADPNLVPVTSAPPASPPHGAIPTTQTPIQSRWR